MLFIFDMGGVVTTTASDDIIEKICVKLGISCEKFFELCEKGSEGDLIRKMDNGILDGKEFWSIIGKKLGKNIECDYWRCFFHPVLNRDVVKIVKWLLKKGHRVVCGTNTIDSHYDNHLCRGDYAFFEQTYTSMRLGVSKPELGFWDMILFAEGFEAENCFFTDDKIENCDAAKSMGIFTYKFENAKGLKKAIGEFLKSSSV